MAVRLRPIGVVVMLLFFVGGAVPAAGAPGDLRVLSTDGAGLVKGDGDSTFPAISDDHGIVAFTSAATNLDPADTDSTLDVYVKNTVNGDLTLASTADDGTKSNGDCHDPNLSADGSVVTFACESTNLDPADTDAATDIYVKNLTTGDLILASTNDSNTHVAGGSLFPTVSGDGKLVAFSSDVQLDASDNDNVFDIYVKNLVTGDASVISKTALGTLGNDASFNGNISQDGTRVAFQSFATNLDANDSDPGFDIYVKDLGTGTLFLASQRADGTKGNGDSQLPVLSADGTRVSFRTAATNLKAADTDAASDVYVKNLTNGALTLASTNDAGVKANGDSLSPTISINGRWVAFRSTATNLDPGDGDATSDVYVKDLSTGNVILASTGATGTKGNGDSLWPSLSDDGRYLAFYSASDNLTTADPDSVLDVYLKTMPQSGKRADLAMTLVDRNDPVAPGGTEVYRAIVQNLGPSRATGVHVRVELPAGTSFVSAASNRGSCSQSAGVVTCAFSTVGSGDQVIATVRVTAPNAPGGLTANAVAAATEADPNGANNTDSETTTVS